MEIKTIDKHFYKQLGMQLRKIRQEKELSLKDMRDKTGFSKTLIDFWELGQTRIKPDQYKILCDALGIESDFEVEVRL